MKVLTSLFIQPTYDCALDCDGCYVKTSVRDEQMSSEVIQSLIRYLWVTRDYWIKQVTLAVDNIPSDEVVRDKMVGALSTALRMRKLYPQRTELHLTINSLKTLDKYIDSGLPLQYIAMNADLISISNLSRNDIPSLLQLRRFTDVNYNYIPGNNLAAYREMVPWVDMSHLLFFKNGLGRKNDPESVRTFREALAEIATWTLEEKQKISIDGCVRDVVKYRESGFGCSAGISKAHIWPSGRVTGCPYNKDKGRSGRTLGAILQNLHESLGTQEFRSCTISEVLQPAKGLRVIR